jgi:TRAP-type C4-dicarboxylate transport system substrate-binding protein
LTENFEDVDLLWDVARPTIEKALADEGLVLLYSIPFPPQGLYHNDAIDKVQDLKGDRLRVYNETGRKMAELMGMIPVNIEQAKLVKALNNNEVDAAITSASTGYDRKLWKYFYRFYTLNSWSPRTYVFVNKDAWDSLSAQTQRSIKEISLLIEELGEVQVKQLTQILEGRLSENNLAVEEPREMLRGQLNEIGEQMRQQWISQAGAAGDKLIKEYLAQRR